MPLGPPRGHGPHHDRFHLHALDAPLHLEAGFLREEIDLALRDHVLARALLLGTYERKRR